MWIMGYKVIIIVFFIIWVECIMVSNNLLLIYVYIIRINLG